MHLIDVGGQTINTSTAMGRMFLTMMAGFAELERGLARERTRDALQHKKRRGLVYNHAPLGYVRDGDELHPDIGEQEVIARIMDWRRSGVSYGGIAKRLNAGGIKGKQGGAFHASTIHKIVGNDIHHGDH
jgi:DNA invertase Pin-like site-specific DNA recombinase